MSGGGSTGEEGVRLIPASLTYDPVDLSDPETVSKFTYGVKESYERTVENATLTIPRQHPNRS